MTVLMLTYSHFFEKPRTFHRQVFSTMTTPAEVKKAESYLDRFYFVMSYVDCGAAYEAKGHVNNAKYLIQAMKAVHDCEKAGVPVDRRILVADETDDFMEDLAAVKDPRSEASKLGIDPWERFW
jgi:hypothetical protein